MTPHPPTLTATSYRLLVGALMCALYMALWFVVDAGGRLWNADGLADLPFLPASVRVAGFLMIGLWIIPSLFSAFAILTIIGAMAYPELGLAEQLGLGVFVASGGPLALALTVRVTQMSTDLVDVGVRDVLALSLACAAGNAILYNAGLTILGLGVPGVNLGAVIFLGDILGSMIMLGLALGAARIAGGRAPT
jgi:hypothetical protein